MRSDPLSATIFTFENLVLMTVVTLGLSLLAAALHPRGEGAFPAETKALDHIVAFAVPGPPEAPTPADRLMHSPWLNRAIGALGLGYVALQAREGAFSPTLDSVNLVVLTLALLLHPSAASIVRAAEEASRPLHGVVLQFPLYAGIYGIIKDTGLAEALAQAFLALATPKTFPFVVFVYSAILNYWVPSGGAKWAMEAPYLLEAAKALGVGPARVAMAYAYGDMATNLIQPFWAIPLLGVARLSFRDILGFELLFLAAYGAAVSSCSWSGRGESRVGLAGLRSSAVALQGPAGRADSPEARGGRPCSNPAWPVLRVAALLGLAQGRGVAHARANGDAKGAGQEGSARPLEGRLDVVDPGAPIVVLLREASLDGGSRLEGIAVGFVDALAPVVPVPLHLGAVVLLDVVTALELRHHEDVHGGKAAGRDPHPNASFCLAWPRRPRVR
jgi:hypothetical protein